MIAANAIAADSRRDSYCELRTHKSLQAKSRVTKKSEDKVMTYYFFDKDNYLPAAAR